MTLELKHLAPYLPYGLFMFYEKGDSTGHQIFELYSLNEAEIAILTEPEGMVEWVDYVNCNPLLRPLSDLTKEIEHNGEKFVPIRRIRAFNEKQVKPPIQFWYLAEGHGKYVKTAYEGIRLLFEWHFDVFGLIDHGLAKPITNQQ